MKYRNLFIALLLSVVIPAATNTLKAQQNTTTSSNNIVMNEYTYQPELYQRGSSTAEMKMFPNPARSTATIYINSIKEQDNGEVVIYNTRGIQVYKNIIQPGNNNISVSNFANGIYIVKVFTKDKFIYTQQLVVSK